MISRCLDLASDRSLVCQRRPQWTNRPSTATTTRRTCARPRLTCSPGRWSSVTRRRSCSPTQPPHGCSAGRLGLRAHRASRSTRSCIRTCHDTAAMRRELTRRIAPRSAQAAGEARRARRLDHLAPWPTPTPSSSTGDARSSSSTGRRASWRPCRERATARAKRASRRTIFEAALEVLPDIVLIHDEEQILFANAACRRFLAAECTRGPRGPTDRRHHPPRCVRGGPRAPPADPRSSAQHCLRTSRSSSSGSTVRRGTWSSMRTRSSFDGASERAMVVAQSRLGSSAADARAPRARAPSSRS